MLSQPKRLSLLNEETLPILLIQPKGVFIVPFNLSVFTYLQTSFYTLLFPNKFVLIFGLLLLYLFAAYEFNCYLYTKYPKLLCTFYSAF